MAAKKKRTTPAGTARQAHRRKRMAEALEYRKVGVSYRDIAEAMHISVSTAHQYVADALKDITREPAEQVLALELDRLDQLLMGIFTQAASGDTFAIDRALAIMARIEKLHGVEAPKEQDAADETFGLLRSIRLTLTKEYGIDQPEE